MNINLSRESFQAGNNFQGIHHYLILKNQLKSWIYLISRQGTIFCVNSNEIYYSNEYSLGYLNDKTQLKNDYFFKIITSSHYLDIETNKNKSARLDLNKLNFKSKKSNFLIDFLKLDNDEYLENCFRLENFLD